jgi:hypothetical protein
METNYLSQLNVVLRELITAECQAMKAEVQGRKADAETHRAAASHFLTELDGQLQILDARLRALEQRPEGLTFATVVGGAVVPVGQVGHGVTMECAPGTAAWPARGFQLPTK